MNKEIEQKTISIDPLKIRNFSIIAHIDHGKSTLASCLLMRCNSRFDQQILHRIPLEAKKGITIKLNAVQLYYLANDQKTYVLNLIDTPGHVDFTHEVARSLSVCEGVVLLVDATQGIQAQTLSYYEIAKEQNLVIIPVISKIDSSLAQIETFRKQLADLVQCTEESVVLVSAKVGQNISALFEAIINKVPAPRIPKK